MERQEELELRIIDKRNPDGSWSVRRMEELRKGDKFRFSDDNIETSAWRIWTATSDPYLTDRFGQVSMMGDIWAIDAEDRPEDNP